MSAGQLNRAIRVDARVPGGDGYGNQLTESWTTLIESEPAEIRPLRGSEEVIAAKLQSRGLVEIRVRYSATTLQITEEHRIVNARQPTETYNVRYIEQPDMRGKYLKIVCERGVALG